MRLPLETRPQADSRDFSRFLAAAQNVIDTYRISARIHVGQSLKGEDVVTVRQRLPHELGLVPESIQVDNGSEFSSQALDHWAYDQHVTRDFSRPGKPTDKAYIESLNGSFRDECLNGHWFLSLADAQKKIEHRRPPAQFVTKFNAR